MPLKKSLRPAGMNKQFPAQSAFFSSRSLIGFGLWVVALLLAVISLATNANGIAPVSSAQFESKSVQKNVNGVPIFDAVPATEPASAIVPVRQIAREANDAIDLAALGI